MAGTAQRGVVPLTAVQRRKIARSLDNIEASLARIWRALDDAGLDAQAEPRPRPRVVSEPDSLLEG